MWTAHPEIAKLLNNPSDGYKYHSTSDALLEWCCPICKHIQLRKLRTIFQNGFICELCTDGFSKPEKFMRSVLLQLNIDFEIHKSFSWSGEKSYDFYFNNILCETHGLQHYEHGFQCSGARSLEDEQENDRYKQKLAYMNGFDDASYIVIDCRKSEKDWIKNSILNSKLAEYFDLTNVDWDKCEVDCMTSLMHESCDLWNKGLNTSQIKETLHLSPKTSCVSQYLKICASNGMCDYDPVESRKNASIRKVICLNTNEVFNSIKEAQLKYNINNISGCCIGQINSAGKHPITGESLKWMHYDKYLKINSK